MDKRKRKEQLIKKKKKEQLERLKQSSPEEYQKRKQDHIKQTGFTIGAALAGVLVILLAVAGIHSAVSRNSSPKPKLDNTEDIPVFESKDITIGSTGCMLLHDQVLESYTSDGEHYDFSDVYKYIAPYYSAVDFMTCEFEGTLTGEDYSGFPSFHSPDTIIENIRDAGVDLQLLATNHVYDALSSAFHRTMNTYDSKGISYTGIRQNTSVKPYYIADIQGIKVGFVNYVYESDEEGVYLNSIPIEPQDQDLINTFDPGRLDPFYTEIRQILSDMQNDGAQYLIACLHWGEEYHLEEIGYQDQIAQKLCDMGVDAIIGGHPHCEEPIDLLTSSDGGHRMFCIYSVGNALSNQRAELIDEMPDGHTEDGVMVTLTLYQDEEGSVSLKDVALLPTWVSKTGTENNYTYYILPLDNVENIETLTGLKGIRADAEASRKRTIAVLESGWNKVKQSLPISKQVNGKL